AVRPAAPAAVDTGGNSGETREADGVRYPRIRRAARRHRRSAFRSPVHLGGDGGFRLWFDSRSLGRPAPALRGTGRQALRARRTTEAPAGRPGAWGDPDRAWEVSDGDCHGDGVRAGGTPGGPPG